MRPIQASWKWLAALALVASPGPNLAARGADKVAGIVIDRKDNTILVKADGEAEPVKYLTVGASDKAIAEALKGIFSASRVELTYTTDGGSRKVVGIKKLVPKASGVVTGEVVKNYGWWVEVKPKQGVSDGYACNFPFDKNKDTMEKLKGLRPGDLVTIRFTTDFERHRIQSLSRNGTPAAGAKASEQGGKVAGILIDREAGWITVKADGEDRPVKYVFDPADRNLKKAFQATFNACRVQLTYKDEGDARRLVSIRRQILRESGTVTGTVVKVYNNFWVEVKPPKGVADAYAPGANYNDKEFMDGLKGLKPGDSVTILFTTDFERHRIQAMRVNPPVKSK